MCVCVYISNYLVPLCKEVAATLSHCLSRGILWQCHCSSIPGSQHRNAHWRLITSPVKALKIIGKRWETLIQMIIMIPLPFSHVHVYVQYIYIYIYIHTTSYYITYIYIYIFPYSP